MKKNINKDKIYRVVALKDQGIKEKEKKIIDSIKNIDNNQNKNKNYGKLRRKNK